ncbi:nuclease-related domain-containing protein [Thermoanaerobacter mathranii]|uniref:nuclease-related domain-containing protein n=1 Tax=Thermoanaerobacter mathranii TaxID=583357 RepID=UPI003D6AFDF6
MFACFIEQDREIKDLFYKKVKEKEEKEKQKRLYKISECFLGWLLEPIADVAYTWRRIAEKEQGSSGENSAGWALHLWLPGNAVGINDLVLEVEPDEFIQIDHLVLNTNGIFVLETKSWDGAFLGTKDCSMPVVIGGMNAVGEIRKIKGENISEEDINLIIEAVKNAKPLDHEEWKKKHSEKKKEVEKDTKLQQVILQMVKCM